MKKEPTTSFVFLCCSMLLFFCTTIFNEPLPASADRTTTEPTKNVDKLYRRNNNGFGSFAEPYSSALIGYANDSIDKNWHLRGNYGICANDAWKITEGDSSVVVGVIDGNPNNSNGFIEHLTYAYNVCAEEIVHSTMVSGIIGSKGYQEDNEIFAKGIAPNVSIISYNVGFNNSQSIVNAFSDACQSCDIINFSGGINSDQISTLRNIIARYTGLIVCASGNHGMDIGLDGNHIYPACFAGGLDSLPNVISVGANDMYGNIMSNSLENVYSNWSSEYVDLFAPGDNIFNLNGEFGDYGRFKSGTSFASPMVAATAALIKSINRELSASSIKQIICSSVSPFASGYNYNLCSSGGILNCYEALKKVAFSTSDDVLTTTITGLNFDKSGTLFIPNTINSKTVTSVDNNAFYSLSNLDIVVVPELAVPIVFGSNVFSFTNTNMKILVPNNQLTYYRNQNNLSPYSDRIFAYYFENSNLIVSIANETNTLCGSDIGEWATYYDDDDFSNGVSSGFLINDELYIVAILNSYYAYCLLNEVLEEDIICVSLEIALDSTCEGMEVFLLDENASYVDTYEVINGYLEIDLTSLINSEMSCFALYPANSNTDIAFLPEDVEMFITFNTIVEIEL